MHESLFNSHKVKQRCGVSTSSSHGHKKSHTPERRPLPPLPMFHSTPLALPHRLSSESTSAHLSFNQSLCSLPPLNLGEGDTHPISSVGIPIQAGIPSIAGPMTLPSMSVPTLNLSADHTKQSLKEVGSLNAGAPACQSMRACVPPYPSRVEPAIPFMMWHQAYYRPGAHAKWCHNWCHTITLWCENMM